MNRTSALFALVAVLFAVFFFGVCAMDTQGGLRGPTAILCGAGAGYSAHFSYFFYKTQTQWNDLT